MKHREEQINQLREAIAAQEALRAKIGDAAVDAALKSLRSSLESLLAEETETGDAKGDSKDDLLAKLRSYLPKQLAEKIRASGHMEGERRQVTVVFADISGFTALSEQLGPEEVASFSNDCLKEFVDAVYQYDGMVDKFIGDCIMAVFGAPVALEDDAERALRAALSMRERLEQFNARWVNKIRGPLALHIGINSGTVIAGNVGSDLRMSYTVMGDTVNVASRLKNAATRGQIFVSQNTFRLTAGAFRFHALEPITVKGKRAPLTVYELIDAKVQPDKIRGLEELSSPFVGREWESKVFGNALRAARTGRSAIILVYGYAGVGKSRLLTEVHSHDSEGVTWLEGRCFASTQTLSYAPIIDLLRRRSGITNDQSLEEQQAALRHHVSTDFPAQPEVYAVLAQLLSLPLSETDAELLKGFRGEEFRARFFSIVEQRLLALSEKQPVVMVTEDLHWVDQSTIDLLLHIMPLVKRARLTFVVVSRSRQEPESVWSKLNPVLQDCREYLVELPLQPLSDDSSRKLLTELLGGDYLPESLTNEILDRSEGNPFFVEEVLRSLIERGGLVLQGTKWVVTNIAGAPVPDTLQGVLLSRLDQLSEELKQLAQRAAVIGRIFLYRLLGKIVEPDVALDVQLASLEELDLIHEHSRLPELEYAFKHVLTQEVAYQTLLAPARKALHEKVGDALETLFPDRLQEFAAVLAHHYYSAESWEKALHYSARAGDAEFQVYAYPEARGHYRQALICLEHLGADPKYQAMRINLTLQLARVSMLAQSPEKNIAMLTEAEAVARSLGDTKRLVSIQLWIGLSHYRAGNLREATSYLQQVLAAALSSTDPELVALSKSGLARVLFLQGHLKESLRLLDETIASLQASKNYHEMLWCLVFRGGAHVSLGSYAAGMADINRALETARMSRDKNAETAAYTGLSFVHAIAGEYTEAMETARKILKLAEATGESMFRYYGNRLAAVAAFRGGQLNESLAYWATGHEMSKALGGRLVLDEWIAAVEAETLLESGDVAAALKRAEEARSIAQASASIIGEALAECAIGRALAAISARQQEATSHFTKSLGILEAIGARYDLARTALAAAKAAVAAGDKAAATPAIERAIALSRECQLRREEELATVLMAQV